MSDIQPRYFTGTLIYVSEHGDVPNSVSLPAGISLPESYLPELTADGYNFLGWYSTSTYDIGTEVAAGYIFPTSELTIYAKWEALKSLKQTLTAIADEIRVLSGTENAMGLDAMATHVEDANTDVATQTELLAQAVAALEGKVGGSSGNTGSVMQIASGTYYLRTEHSSAKQITISGLEFAPKSLIIYFGSEVGKTYYFPEANYILCSLQVGELFDYTATCISPQSGSSIAMSGIHNCDDKYSIQLTHDGFILSYPNDDYAVSVGTYFYHAFG